MEDFKSVILAFADKGSPFEELEAEMVRLVKANPQSSSDLLSALSDAKEEGVISDIQYNALLSELVAADTIAATDSGAAPDEEAHTQDPKQFFSQTGLHKVETVGPGTIIKERFELMDVLGVGGMGMVYKARDLIKVEAKDRNPYLAIKVLNENFKKHPESFIALQRECSRTQKLAHPNIATVYDFDRFGSMVYMTMQLLDGKPLNEFIKEDVPKGGLSFAEAFPIIEDMGNALAYAHSQHIVHSDLKPGNSFITKEHGVQVLDFGIARAVKRPGQQDTTLFDAGKLGALTPAYASCEMLEDEEPDPRDDIYALAVVAYILLSGEHPYDKFPATLARDHGMVAKPIKKISRAQNKALQRGLAFHREECSADVKEFLEEFKPTSSSTGKYIGAAIAATVVLALLAIYPVQNYLQQQREADVVTQLASGDPVVVKQILSELASREDISAENVLSSSRDALLAYYHKQVEEALTGANGPNNFQLSESLLAEARQWYPESVQVQKLASRIQQHKTRIVDAIDDAFYKIANQMNLNAAGEGRSVPELMALLARVDPGHALNNDQRIPVVYAEVIDQAINEQRMLDADILLKESASFAGGNTHIADVQAEMRRRSDATYTPAKKTDKKAYKARKAKRKEALQAANVAAMMRSISIKTDSGRPDKAVGYLAALAEHLPAESSLLKDTGPKMIASSYLNQAKPYAESGQYDRAIEMVMSGLGVDPDNEKLQQALKKYQASLGL